MYLLLLQHSLLLLLDGSCCGLVASLQPWGAPVSPVCTQELAGLSSYRGQAG